jgi:hypothetical protein
VCVSTLRERKERLFASQCHNNHYNSYGNWRNEGCHALGEGAGGGRQHLEGTEEKEDDTEPADKADGRLCVFFWGSRC